MKWDWKRPSSYSLILGEKHRQTFLYHVTIHPALWVLIGFGILLSVYIVPWCVCTPALLPVLLSCRRYRNKTPPEKRSRRFRMFLPDGGLGQTSEEPWWEIGNVNGGTQSYEGNGMSGKEHVVSLKEFGEGNVEGRGEERERVEKMTNQDLYEIQKEVEKKRKKVQEHYGDEKDEEDDSMKSSKNQTKIDSDSEDVFNSSDSSEEEF
ncbi:hypothetical protein BLNAU_8296 [Blattamonas nauphoetae]|uniref:Uncharacterized protein n=1 Tax=Blattamonas nauphoetae TaxID=2049346 RepID=A0ABQ9XYT7_9EUKA|nr:hypothetical protein BLNAU_8296 [Blattamonas nauphoetae]